METEAGFTQASAGDCSTVAVVRSRTCMWVVTLSHVHGGHTFTRARWPHIHAWWSHFHTCTVVTLSHMHGGHTFTHGGHSFTYHNAMEFRAPNATILANTVLINFLNVCACTPSPPPRLSCRSPTDAVFVGAGMGPWNYTGPFVKNCMNAQALPGRWGGTAGVWGGMSTDPASCACVCGGGGGVYVCVCARARACVCVWCFSVRVCVYVVCVRVCMWCVCGGVHMYVCVVRVCVCVHLWWRWWWCVCGGVHMYVCVVRVVYVLRGGHGCTDTPRHCLGPRPYRPVGSPPKWQ